MHNRAVEILESLGYRMFIIKMGGWNYRWSCIHTDGSHLNGRQPRRTRSQAAHDALLAVYEREGRS